MLHFDPTIRLDFVLAFGGVILVAARFVARLQAQMSANTDAIGRVSSLVEKLENRQRATELTVAAHMGAAEREVVDR